MSQTHHSIRLATLDDSDAVREIYAAYIDTAITFETSTPSSEEFKKRVEDILEFFPLLVVEDEQQNVVGFAYGHKFSERQAYDWTSILSIYLSKDTRGKGLGSTLYTCLIDLLREQGVRTVLGRLLSGNDASEKLHRKLGFELAGTIENSGYKLGAWRSLSTFTKVINDFDVPNPLIPLKELDADVVKSIIDKANAQL